MPVSFHMAHGPPAHLREGHPAGPRSTSGLGDSARATLQGTTLAPAGGGGGTALLPSAQSGHRLVALRRTPERLLQTKAQGLSSAGPLGSLPLPLMSERGTETERDRHTDTQGQRETDRDRGRDKGQAEIERQGQRERHTQSRRQGGSLRGGSCEPSIWSIRGVGGL